MHTQILAIISIVSAALSLSTLLTLHTLSREFHPSWRMISEYANGKYNFLLTAFFLLWSASNVSLAILIFQTTSGVLARVGIALLMLSGIGALMGGIFSIRHKLHGVSFALGIPTLPAAAVIISHCMKNSTLIMLSHFTWISVLLVVLSMASLFSAFKKAGIQMGPDKKAPENLPPGVFAWNGYANRVLVIAYLGWAAATAYTYL